MGIHILSKIYNIPKKGTRKATQTLEATRVVLKGIMHHQLLDRCGGSNSSRLLANGFSNKGYLNKGLKTCNKWERSKLLRNSKFLISYKLD